MLTALVTCAVDAQVSPAAPPQSGVNSTTSSPVKPTSQSTPPRHLDLRIGPIERYVDARVLATPAFENLEEIIVRGQRPDPLPEQRVIPGNVGALKYAFDHPLQAWRIFVPDPNAVVPERTEDDVREAPGAFRGKILEPGQIHD